MPDLSPSAIGQQALILTIPYALGPSTYTQLGPWVQDAISRAVLQVDIQSFNQASFEVRSRLDDNLRYRLYSALIFSLSGQIEEQLGIEASPVILGASDA